MNNIVWCVFDGKNTLRKTYLTKRAAMKFVAGRTYWTIGKASGNRIIKCFDNAGRELQFVSHGGDFGEWR